MWIDTTKVDIELYESLELELVPHSFNNPYQYQKAGCPKLFGSILVIGIVILREVP